MLYPYINLDAGTPDGSFNDPLTHGVDISISATSVIIQTEIKTLLPKSAEIKDLLKGFVSYLITVAGPTIEISKNLMKNLTGSISSHDIMIDPDVVQMVFHQLASMIDFHITCFSIGANIDCRLK